MMCLTLSATLCFFSNDLFGFSFQENRVKYNQQHYKDVFHDQEMVKAIDKSMKEPSLREQVEVRRD